MIRGVFNRMKTIVNNFAHLLIERNLTVTQVSEQTGISRTTLTQIYKRREKTVSRKVVAALCEFLGCGIDEFWKFRDI